MKPWGDGGLPKDATEYRERNLEPICILVGFKCRWRLYANH